MSRAIALLLLQFFVALVISVEIGSIKHETRRIVRGKNAVIGQFPFMVLINEVCAGSCEYHFDEVYWKMFI